jgi:Flp pilus assembly CpaE family ATPase
MIVISVCSAKHSPGATTLALALMCAWHTDPGLAGSDLLVEADPAGGDLAARLGLSADPGLVSLAASARHGDQTIDVWAHSQVLPAGGRVVLAPTDSTRSSTAVAAVADRLPALVRAGVDRAVIDVGRWSADAATTAVLSRSDVVILVARPDLAGIDHARTAANTITEISGALISVVLCGDRPYGPDDVARSTVARLSFALPIDRRSAADLYMSPPNKLRRSPLIRAARSLTEQLAAVNAVPA